MPHHSHRDFARTIWRAYGRLSLPRFFLSWLERLAQTGSRYSTRSKMQITFSPYAVLPRLILLPLASALLLVRRAIMVEHGSKDKWNRAIRGGLVGFIVCGRWCVISICLCLPQLRERSEQNGGPLTSVLLAWGVLAFNIRRPAYRRMGRCITQLTPSLHSLSPRSAAAHPLASDSCSR